MLNWLKLTKWLRKIHQCTVNIPIFTIYLNNCQFNITLPERHFVPRLVVYGTMVQFKKKWKLKIYWQTCQMIRKVQINFGSDKPNSLEVHIYSYCNIYRNTFLIHVCRAETKASVLHLTFKAVKDHKSPYLKIINFQIFTKLTPLQMLKEEIILC